MSDSDVDVILQNYFATIAEKDSDALKLFEDNKRMRRLVEQALGAREELEAQLRTTQVLVASLQADLREKQLLIAAQDAESAAWREGMAELRVVLDRPSELDHGLRDVVEDVRGMAAELRSLRQGMQYAQWCCSEWEGYVVDFLTASEDRERRALEQAALPSLRALCEAASEVHSVRLLAAAQEALASTTVAQWEALHASTRQKGEASAQKQAQALHRTGMEVQHHARRAYLAESAAHELQQRLTAEAELARWAQTCSALASEERDSVVDLLVERCAAAEGLHRATAREVRRLGCALAASQDELRRLTDRHEALLTEQEQGRLRLAKLSRRVEESKEQQSALAELQQRYSTAQEEMQALRDRYISLADKERHLRHQHGTATEAASTKLQDVEESLQAAERHKAVLEERLRASQDEAKAAHKEVFALRKQQESAQATEAVLQATQAQLRETERHAFNFQEALDTLKAEHQAELCAVQDRHAQAMAALAEGHEEALEQRDATWASRLAEAEARERDAAAATASDKAKMQAEVGAWAAEVEKLKKVAARCRERAEAEAAARLVLEEQSRSEASVLRSVMERSLDEARRAPVLVDVQTRLASVQQRNRLLDEACRRSAGVIAQLRESLHREQMVSRALRLREEVDAATTHSRLTLATTPTLR